MEDAADLLQEVHFGILRTSGPKGAVVLFVGKQIRQSHSHHSPA